MPISYIFDSLISFFYSGTTAALFLQFIDALLLRLPMAVVGVPGRIFLWDNLRSHYNGIVNHRIYAAGHSIIPRPPYSPVYGPIEYIFNHIEGSLQQRMYQVRNVANLRRHIYDIVSKITAAHIRNTFLHCGY